ncbi:alkane 1-monooxygenase [Algivirga pacifica]|uniref:Alkane 1-monooxygenase n=1 Tax=Algivirga pacifica TaxID=1162670 RepID=A0ABP9CXS9_9BACT
MATRDFKYLIAYLLPISALTGLYLQGYWVWLNPILVFILVPLLESILPVDQKNVSPEKAKEKSGVKFFDFLLYLNVVLVYATVFLLLQQLVSQELSTAELVGSILSTGIVLGASGINVAHELGHRSGTFDYIMAQLLLIPSLYSHFTLEHNRGHHKNVATPLDPATSRKGEWVYGFWVRSVVLSYLSAWRIQLNLLSTHQRSFWSFHNRLLWGQLSQLALFGGVGYYYGLMPLLWLLCGSIIGFLLLETINYIEHYGLMRTLNKQGRYERVMPHHSWNANYEVGRILLYELTRHSDHHYLASKKYQVLDHHEEAPLLPFGYPTAILIALFPPLWFAIMDKRLPNTTYVHNV